MKRLDGEIAIVTGAATGIGKGIAKLFLQEGASVLLVDIAKDQLEATRFELTSLIDTAKVHIFDVDLRKTGVTKEIVERAVSEFGQIDILVNCAGIYPSTTALKITEEEWDSVYDLNVKSTFFLSQEIANHMIQKGVNGRIINISSTASEVARPGVAHYCSSKAAVKMMTQVLALEWAKYGIRINALGPGLVETENLLESLVTETAKSEHQEKITNIPLQRSALIEEIAEGVLYFASNQSNYVTGQTLLVDGGYSAGRVLKTKLD